MKNAYKLFSIFIIVGVVVAATLNGYAFAGSTAKSLSTNFTLVNFSTTNDADVTVQYMKDDGTAWTADPANTTFTIPKNFGMNQIRQYFDNTLDPGKGSVVVLSSEQLGAIVQIQARNQTPTQGAYSGYSAGSNLFYVPLAAKNRTTASGFANSQIVVQNTDSINFTATIDLYMGSTKTYTKTTPELLPGQSYYYDLADEAVANVPNEWVGSAVVTGGSSGKVAVVSNFFTGPNAMQTFNGFPQESVGPKWMIPLFFSRLPNGLSTVVTVQNLSGGPLAANSITLACTSNRGDTPATLSVKNPAELALGASYSFNPVTNDGGLFPTGNWGGSCNLDAGAGNVVVIVQMRYVGVAGNEGAAAYEAISTSPSAVTGKTMVVPLVLKRLPNGFATVVTIQNIDLVDAAIVDLVYKPSFTECPVSSCDMNHDGLVNELDTITVSDVNIPAGASVQRNHRLPSGSVDAEDTLPDNWTGSLTVTSSTTNINGFVQITKYMGVVGDTFMAHDAFVLTLP